MPHINRSSPSKHQENKFTKDYNRIDDYQLVQLLGEGTYGEVHKAIHKKTGNVVAIKKLKLINDEQGVSHEIHYLMIY
jgi:serine/threonine-protein kinase BUR1